MHRNKNKQSTYFNEQDIFVLLENVVVSQLPSGLM